jgi:hypothetical protein
MLSVYVICYLYRTFNILRCADIACKRIPNLTRKLLCTTLVRIAYNCVGGTSEYREQTQRAFALRVLVVGSSDARLVVARFSKQQACSSSTQVDGYVSLAYRCPVG